jgi:hypothetical protein
MQEKKTLEQQPKAKIKEESLLLQMVKENYWASDDCETKRREDIKAEMTK